MMTIAAVVVTYNRQELLVRCLTALMQQTRKPDRILVVDNASTDGTIELLRNNGWLDVAGVELLPLKHNSGGAGGFSAGLARFLELGLEWAWMMDDDAVPHPDALEQLVTVARSPTNVYGSLAVSGQETAWTITLMDGAHEPTRQRRHVPDGARVVSLPFLGFMIHRSLISRIGLPDTGFFIAADDIEYCLRAQSVGADIIIAAKSLIEHPKSCTYEIKFLGYRLTTLRLPPWKRYYDTRNRILIARKYYGFRLFTQTIPGSLLRMVGVLVKEPNKRAQFRAFFAGFIDGILGRKGRRHQQWGIQQ